MFKKFNLIDDKMLSWGPDNLDAKVFMQLHANIHQADIDVDNRK